MWLLPTPISALLKGKNVETVAAITIILPCADAKDPDDHPTMLEAQIAQADCPEVPVQGAPKITGADQVDPPADITGTPQVVALPAVPPYWFKSPLNTTPDCAPPSNTTRIALKSS